MLRGFLKPNHVAILVHMRSKARETVRNHPLPVLLSVGGTLTACHLLYKFSKSKETGNKRRSTERRFINFASTEYDGQIYMTPIDFIESLLETEPRRRHKRRKLTKTDLDEFKAVTPKQTAMSPKFFRTVRDKGIISYMEYLFLLSILIKPVSGFKIAFKMFDTDYNETVDKSEYQIIEKIFGENYGPSGNTVDDDEGLQKKHAVDTTLMVHFFGPNGDQLIKFDQFDTFMTYFQEEVLELEFLQYAHGLSVISEVDFAKIILRYTDLDEEHYDEYLDVLLERLDEEEQTGIDFEEFSNFMRFLNNLDDFMLAMKMYTLLHTPISPKEFQKAVKICTGHVFSEHLVKTVFAIFDYDGDGLLSYKEFVFAMKSRQRRGMRSQTKKSIWKNMTVCLNKEMKEHTEKSI